MRAASITQAEGLCRKVVPYRRYSRVGRFIVMSRGIKSMGNRCFERLPHPFARIDLGTVRWLKHQHHIRRDHQRLGPVRAGIIHQNQIQALRVCLGEIIQKALHHRSRERRKLHEVAGTAERFHRSKDPGILELVLVNADWFDPTGGDALAVDGVQAEPTLITRPDPHRLLIGRRNGIPQVRHKVRFKSGDGRRVFFGLVGRGTLGLAPSL